MADDFQEKQHLPTAKKLSALRRKGIVLRSRDLTSGIVLLFACLVFLLLSTPFYRQIKENFILCFTLFNHDQDYLFYFPAFLKKMAITNALLILPILCICFLGAFMSPFLFGGWNYSLESIAFNINKLNPITNLAKMFSPERIVFEILKSFYKFLFLLLASFIFIFYKKNAIFNLVNYSATSAAHYAFEICVQFVMCLLIVITVISFIDAMYQHYEYMKQAKMTAQEMKDEFKETEGNVDVKRKMRSAQFALFKQRLSITVPRSTVIITNPTHYAVALRYNVNRDNAPVVLAKGTDQIAQQIRYYAISHAIPIYEAPVLARAIFHTTKIGFEIKPGLYMAVAIVLSYVNQLKHYQMGVGPQPQYVSDIAIPEEYIYDR